MDHTNAGCPDRSPQSGRVHATVAGMGQCALDYLCTIDRYPPPDTKCEFSDFLLQGGGPVATALVALTRWGVSTRFAGVVCGDRFGRAILEGLQDEKVDVSAVRVREGGRSQFAFICVEKETGKRTIFWGRPEGSSCTDGEVPEGFLDNVHVLHLDGLFAEASLHLAKQAKARGIPVVLDAGSLRAGMLELIRHTDHLIASEEFIGQFQPETPLTPRLHSLRQMGPRVVTVTRGARGSVSLWEETPQWLPALQVKARDTTGAGDVFHGAYIYGLLQGWGIPDRIRWATVAAGLSCRFLGGRTGIPTLEEVTQGLSWLSPFTNWDQSAD
jgi:sulfofructose kinase